MAKDYYEILGVDKNASFNEIKKAFRLQAKKCHPDLHPGDPAAATRYKEVNDAYSVLSDPKAKESYDRFGHAGVDLSKLNGSSPYGVYDVDLGDFLALFGVQILRKTNSSE